MYIKRRKVYNEGGFKIEGTVASQLEQDEDQWKKPMFLS
jgi:hypothetical protein